MSMFWAAEERLNEVPTDRKILINPKKREFNTCILPAMTYGMETMTRT